MKKKIIIYHGSQQIVEKPRFGIGKKYNDYGQGFYCTENIELAKEFLVRRGFKEEDFKDYTLASSQNAGFDFGG